MLILFVGINIGFVILIRGLTGSLLMAWSIYIGLYYLLIRKAIIWAVFPGSCFFFKRNIELSYMRNTGA